MCVSIQNWNINDLHNFQFNTNRSTKKKIILYRYFDIHKQDRSYPHYNYKETGNFFRDLDTDKVHHSSLQFSQYHSLRKNHINNQ